MTLAPAVTDLLTEELAEEAGTTRRVLERVPEDRLSWRPHPRSMSLGQLALHLAMIPGALAELLREPTREMPAVPLPEPSSRDEILAALDESVATAAAQLSAWSEEDLAAEWQMTRDGATLLALPRFRMLRSVMLNHWYHHRGQLLVYLRLLDVPVPPVYGPTADENPFG